MRRFVPYERSGMEAGCDRVGRGQRLEIDAGDRAGGGDSALIHDHAVGVRARPCRCGHIAVVRHAPTPVAYECHRAVRGDSRAEGSDAGGNRADHPGFFEIHHGQAIFRRKRDRRYPRTGGDGDRAGESRAQAARERSQFSAVGGRQIHFIPVRPVTDERHHRPAGSAIECDRLQTGGAAERDIGDHAIFLPIERVQPRLTRHPEARGIGVEGDPVYPGLEYGWNAGGRDRLPCCDNSRVGDRAGLRPDYRHESERKQEYAHEFDQSIIR